MLNSIPVSSSLKGDAALPNTMVSNAKSDEEALKSLADCRNFQLMIDASCSHLHKLRAPTLTKSGHFAKTSGITTKT